MIRITRPSVTRSCTSDIPWNNTGCPRFRKEELGLRCPWFELEKEKKKKEERKKEGKGREKDTEFFVRLGSDIRRLDSSRPVRRLPTRDTSARLFLPMTHRASEISFPGMTTGGDGRVREKKNRARFAYRSLSISRCANII